MLEELISCKKPDHHKKIMISYVRGVNLQINLMIKITLTKIYKSIFEENQQFTQLLQCLF